MKSIAAYYVILAVTSAEDDAARRRAAFAAAEAPRPSILGRARTLLASIRPTRRPEPASSAA
ncbi:MAG TPA: hypothetical protein VFO05_07370 [Candidatus Limnocylindrales bacterium]|nr:hypothetical protein [Candidatus Limnocylindrales bacterium]